MKPDRETATLTSDTGVGWSASASATTSTVHCTMVHCTALQVVRDVVRWGPRPKDVVELAHVTDVTPTRVFFAFLSRGRIRGTVCRRALSPRRLDHVPGGYALAASRPVRGRIMNIFGRSPGQITSILGSSVGRVLVRHLGVHRPCSSCATDTITSRVSAAEHTADGEHRRKREYARPQL
jgi:hypothetical protein